MRSVLVVGMLAVMPARAQELRITVYDKAEIRRSDYDTTFIQLGRILRNAGIDVAIVAGDLESGEASLIQYASPVGVARQDAICRARDDVALEIIAAPRGLAPGILGIAQPFATAGLNVRVFADRIRAASLAESVPFSTVLAYAITHEVGHLLMKTDAHEKFGIMGSVWTHQEYDWMSYRHLLFTRVQSQRMRSTLTRQGCPAPPSAPTVLQATLSTGQNTPN